MDVTTGKVLKYAILPGILPRIGMFFKSGFAYISFYMAHVYRSVRLLPAEHPYLNPSNMGRFGIRHVIFEAQRNLVFKKENIDQLIIFFALLVGIVVLFMQFALFAGALMMPAAHASAIGAYYASFFTIPDPTYDIAFRLLDLTFGLVNPYPMFNSCVAQSMGCELAFTPGGGYTPVAGAYTYAVPTQFHTALQSLLHFYNYGILVIAFMITAYMVVTIVGETAQSGTPFGKRFNGMWAPVRLVIAIALLTPLSFGLNGAQLLTLMTAKWGSNLATNGWMNFANSLAFVPIQQGTLNPPVPQSLIARPNAPKTNDLLEFMFVVRTCKHMEEFINRRGATSSPLPAVRAFQVFNGGNMPFTSGSFAAALANANNGDIVIRFGVADAVNYARYTGNVKPVCGEIIFNTKAIDNTLQPGSYSMQQAYYELVNSMWNDAGIDAHALSVAKRYTPTFEKDPYATPIPNNGWIASILNNYDTQVRNAVNTARTAQLGVSWNDDFTILGWAGAAIWYQKIAEYAGDLFSAVYGMPVPHLYPEALEHVKRQRTMNNDNVIGRDRFNPLLSNGREVEWEDDRDRYMVQAYYYAQKFWNVSAPKSRSNAFVDTIVSIFGLKGLFDMQNQVDIHPLAQLVGIGRSLIESAVTNLGFSFTGMGLSYILGEHLSSVSAAAASFAGQVAMIGLSIGFILYYIVPFLPFIYFFFAAGGWVKGIFEAMVGLPLWAMAHIRIDGEGLPGPAAMNGYFLIFEIFLRPILIIFGFLASILIFTTQVQILNEIWQLVTSNVMGANYDPAAIAAAPAQVAAGGTGAGTGPVIGTIDWLRGHADQLFFTVMYAIIVYMLAMASFKLIDLIPNNIMRWMNSSVSTFGEQSGDPASTLVQYSYMGSQLALGPINKGIGAIASRAAPKI